MNILVLALSSDNKPSNLDSTSLKIFSRLSRLPAADTAEHQSDEAAAVLIAEDVLPADHLRAGDTISVTTDTRHGENDPEESTMIINDYILVIFSNTAIVRSSNKMIVDELIEKKSVDVDKVQVEKSQEWM